MNPIKPKKVLLDAVLKAPKGIAFTAGNTGDAYHCQENQHGSPHYRCRDAGFVIFRDGNFWFFSGFRPLEPGRPPRKTYACEVHDNPKCERPPSQTCWYKCKDGRVSGVPVQFTVQWPELEVPLNLKPSTGDYHVYVVVDQLFPSKRMVSDRIRATFEGTPLVPVTAAVGNTAGAAVENTGRVPVLLWLDPANHDAANTFSSDLRASGPNGAAVDVAVVCARKAQLAQLAADRLVGLGVAECAAWVVVPEPLSDEALVDCAARIVRNLIQRARHGNELNTPSSVFAVLESHNFRPSSSWGFSIGFDGSNVSEAELFKREGNYLNGIVYPDVIISDGSNARHFPRVGEWFHAAGRTIRASHRSIVGYLTSSHDRGTHASFPTLAVAQHPHNVNNDAGSIIRLPAQRADNDNKAIDVSTNAYVLVNFSGPDLDDCPSFQDLVKRSKRDIEDHIADLLDDDRGAVLVRNSHSDIRFEPETCVARLNCKIRFPPNVDVTTVEEVQIIVDQLRELLCANGLDESKAKKLVACRGWLRCLEVVLVGDTTVIDALYELFVEKEGRLKIGKYADLVDISPVATAQLAPEVALAITERLAAPETQITATGWRQGQRLYSKKKKKSSAMSPVRQSSSEASTQGWTEPANPFTDDPATGLVLARDGLRLVTFAGTLQRAARIVFPAGRRGDPDTGRVEWEEIRAAAQRNAAEAEFRAQEAEKRAFGAWIRHLKSNRERRGDSYRQGEARIEAATEALRRTKLAERQQRLLATDWSRAAVEDRRREGDQMRNQAWEHLRATAYKEAAIAEQRAQEAEQRAQIARRGVGSMHPSTPPIPVQYRAHDRKQRTPAAYPHEQRRRSPLESDWETETDEGWTTQSLQSVSSSEYEICRWQHDWQQNRAQQSAYGRYKRNVAGTASRRVSSMSSRGSRSQTRSATTGRQSVIADAWQSETENDLVTTESEGSWALETFQCYPEWKPQYLLRDPRSVIPSMRYPWPIPGQDRHYEKHAPLAGRHLRYR